MQKDLAIKNVSKTFENAFEKPQFISFIRDLLNEYERDETKYTSVPDEYKDYVSHYERIGKFEDIEEKRIDILIVYLKRDTSIERARSMQRNFIAGYLQGKYGSNNPKDAALVAFVSHSGQDWRFSLVKLDVRLEVDDKGRAKGIEEFTSAKRWSFLVGANEKSHTAQTQFVPIMQDTDKNPTLARLEEAFNVEPVTNEFFREYRRIFEEAEATIKVNWSDDKKRLYTQRFFNRVMFIAFLERKGWLRFEKSSGRKDYLRSLFEDYYHNETDKRTASFHKSRLNTLFFRGLNNPHGDQLSKDPDYKIFQRLIGDVPYLNGGLFEEEPEDIDGHVFPDLIIAKILNELIYQFNFTVTESTPLDIEVAVDPEMLGRIFEELVTGRHESGSYYTPKPVVAFMCREALKGYLKTSLPAETEDALALFVDKNDATGLKNSMAVLDALRTVKVCDPACGSGAYLLGMLHELLEQLTVLFAQHQKDAPTTYKNKLDIIQNNLYGVDKDDFAVNIARLRLWLSLIVDFEGETPPPLPNLDFKIEVGDALTAPDPLSERAPDLLRYAKIREFLQLKNDYQNLHEGQSKKEALNTRIKNIRAEIAEGMHTKKVIGFDWAVEFAEVFQPELAQGTMRGKMVGIINEVSGQMELTDAPKEGGFDIVLANPPYGATVDGKVRDIYFNAKTENGQSRDTYGLFIIRALQLLRSRGQFCFIVSDTWRTIGTHKLLRKRLLEGTTVAHVIDLPSWIFNATVNTCILTLSKQPAPENQEIIASELRGIRPGDWKTLTDNLNEIATHGSDSQTIEFARYTYPQKLIGTFENLSFFIGSPKLYKLMSDESLIRLATISEIKYGIRTGDNARFFLQKPEVRGNYKDVTQLLSNVLSNAELENLTDDEMLNGISEKKKKYIVPLNKGGESNADEKWLPKYYVPTGYYFDWSEKAVSHLKKIKGMRNPEIHFKKGITFSWTGEYAPTFRIAHLGVYDQSSSSIQNFQNFSIEELLGILNSKFIKYQIKNFIDHSVNSDIGVISSIALSTKDCPERKMISEIVKKIIKNQKNNERYDFSQEEKEIDSLVYKMIGLKKEDILEVETWYKRRYPKFR